MEALEDDRRPGLERREDAVDVRRARERLGAPGYVGRVVAERDLLSGLDEAERRVPETRIADEAFDGYPVWSEFLLLFDPLLSDRMRQAGWVADGCTWEDFNVSLDEERRVVVEDMQGRRLTRDGSRVAQ